MGNSKLENLVRKLRTEQFMKEEYEPEPSRDDMDYYHYRRELTGERKSGNELRKWAWDVDTEEMIQECYNE